MTTKVLILGANGFIGNALVRRLLEEGGYEITGLDLASDRLEPCMDDPRFQFLEGNVSVQRLWVEEAIADCDVVLPLVAIATPALYVTQPIRVFELDFEENLRVIRLCVKHRKRVIFPSTSEVYGMCQDNEFLEDETPLVMGPIHKVRWIYGSLKQLLDRLLFAYGVHEGLHYTIFRPFNWIGPKLDAIDAERIGSSRVVTQFIGCIVRDAPITLVDGGMQRRCFTYIGDGIDALVRILKDRSGVTDRQVFNIGNPENDCSIQELARKLRRIYETEMNGRRLPASLAYRNETSERFFGDGYQDLVHRRPSIRKGKELLDWEPRVDLEESLRLTLKSFVDEERRPRTQPPKRTPLAAADRSLKVPGGSR